MRNGVVGRDGVLTAHLARVIAGLSLGSLALAAVSAAQDQDAVRRALQGLGSALDLQTTFPVPKESSSSSWLSYLTANIVRVLLWIAVACGLAALAWYLMDIVPKGLARQARWGELGPDGRTASSASATAAQENADDLASQGRFVEAMHVLLLQSVAEMRRRLDVPLADSLTSREILRRVPVSSAAQHALGDIIAAVERAYFGEYGAEATDYQLCRARFMTLTEALQAGGGA
jgi:hypothetical protein